MSEKVEAIPIEKISASILDNSGDQMLLRLEQPTKELVTLAIPVTQLMSLIELCGTEIEKSKNQKGEDPKNRHAFKATWFELGSSQTGSAVLTLTFGSSAKLSFELPGTMAANMCEVLQTMTGQSIPPKPETPAN